MKNLKFKPFTYFFFVLFVICFVGIALVSGSRVSDLWSALKIAYKTIPLILLFWTGFVTYAWKWRIFKNWLVPFPNINGTWQGTIQTTWENQKTGEAPGPIPVILTIKQSFLHVSCVMRTAEMTSRSYLADFWLDSDEQIRKLGYSYTSSPSVVVADRSNPHDGTMVFEIVGDPVEKLRGQYWTTRKTTGEVALTFFSKKRLDEFPNNLGEHPMKGK